MTPTGAPKNRWIVFSLVAVAVFMSTLDSSIVNMALPAVMSDLEAPLSQIEWVVMSYLLTVSSLLLAFGRLSDIKGRPWVYCRGFFLFSLGSLLCAMASGALQLIFARIFQGVGAAMLMACSPALVADVFPISERGRALGMIGTIVASGLTAGPALGGLILEYFSWRVIFFINIPIGVMSIIVTLRIFKKKPSDGETPREETTPGETFDWPGAALLAVCFCSFILALNRGGAWGYASWPFLACVLTASVGALWFIRVEKRSPHPVFEPSLVRIRLFILPIAAALILFAALFTIVFLMPFYLVHPAGYVYNRAGGMLMIPFVFFFFMSPISGALSDRIGSRLLCTLGMALLAAALFSMAFLTPAASFWSIAWRLALAGFGAAIFLPGNSMSAMNAVPPRHRGIASGAVATARNLGMVMGVGLAGLVFNGAFHYASNGLAFKTYRPDLESAFMTAFKYAMITGGVAAVIGVIIAHARGPENNAQNRKIEK